MHPQIQKAIDELHAALLAHASDQAVSFRLFVSCAETTVEIATRTPEQLRKNCTSMRNLRGEFIRAYTDQELKARQE